MKKQELEAMLLQLEAKMGNAGLAEEIAEYMENAGFADAAAHLEGIPPEKIRELYVSTFADQEGESQEWYEEWHKSFLGQ